MSDLNADIVNATARAAIWAPKTTAIDLNIPVFSGVKSYSITAQQ
jgi:hypothetical protein